MWKGSWLNVRVGGSSDRSVIQFPGPTRGKERCPGLTVTYAQRQLAGQVGEKIITQSSFDGAEHECGRLAATHGVVLNQHTKAFWT